MHSLEEKISRWRNELAVSQGLEEDVVDELADHLHQKLDELSDSDLSDEDKFIVAKTRLGHPSSLCNEFEKLNEYSQRLRRVGYMIGGYLLIDTSLKMVQMVAKTMVIFSPTRKSVVDSASIASTVFIVTGTILLLALFYCLWQAIRIKPPLHNSRIIQRFGAVQRSHPRYTLGMILFALVIVTFANQVGAPLFMARYMSTLSFGHLMMRVSIYNMITMLLIPSLLLVFLAWIIRTNRRMRRKIN